ncbi:unnamed protein product [Didymodactylos carnosus]|uniref:glycogenin glucosyltransferase n=1 Tax=Didymodactylos carnosus TaxID=1234261 RepID=A0A814AJM7_9BILA|nr:unnamed protein product [Didymodactylos carnosus]CAF0915135.1 unnamed protein product [Didymodactylos carnosus]CAF3606891.1 unnamed protein product [Didymodactylos carnosus]CAF3695458.1 unnamed protein product [Didymodactylos carnosus]
MSEAFVTLATTDGYALGALVLGQSLKAVKTERKLCVMITDHVSDLLKRNLEATFDEVIVVNVLDSKDTAHLKLLERPELGVTFTKLHCWILEQYQKCVFLDADCLVLQSVDDLFEREELSASPDAGWPDIFNSGVFVYKPSKDTYEKLVKFASEQGSFDGGDQGLLNKYFSSWARADISRHLPFTYNVTSNTFYSYVPAVNQFRSDIRIVHFAGTVKPWQLTYDPQAKQLSGCYQSFEREFLLKWWELMYETVWPNLSASNTGPHDTMSCLYNIGLKLVSYTAGLDARKDLYHPYDFYSDRDSFPHLVDAQFKYQTMLNKIRLATLKRAKPSTTSFSLLPLAEMFYMKRIKSDETVIHRRHHPKLLIDAETIFAVANESEFQLDDANEKNDENGVIVKNSAAEIIPKSRKKRSHSATLLENFTERNVKWRHSGPLNYTGFTQGIISGSAAHRRAWEAGHIDYGGRDSFSKIQEQIDKNIARTPQTHERPLSASNTQRQQKQSSPPKDVATSNNKNNNSNNQHHQATTGVTFHNEDERFIPAETGKTQQQQGTHEEK